jgi:hypothetical protein
MKDKDEPAIVYYSGFAGWQADPEYVMLHGVTVMLSFFRSYDFKKAALVPEPRVKHATADKRK